ncbi:MAG: hypothetical protein DCC55_29670 [Chloroflexi bacterium]|nr:MAG: hypothetical protein DCC55_29670 [Chloroflexota bacterium]
MTTKVSNYALRLQTSLLAELKKVAEQESTSVNQLINVAVAEKLAALRTETYFRERVARGERKAFRRILDKAGTEAPRPGDELPDESRTPQVTAKA